MITADTPVFPNNVVDLVSVSAGLLDSDLVVIKRPLRASDPVQCVGVFAQQWLPIESSKEMRGEFLGANVNTSSPTLEEYVISVQAMVRDMDEENGLAVHSVLSELIRTMLYRGSALGVVLASLTTTLNGVQKRTGRWGVRQQRYFSNEIEGTWIYLSTLEFWLETETV